MDETELTRLASQALDSAKSAHHRLDAVEAEVKDIRSLTAAMAAVNQKVDSLKSDVDEVKSDVKSLAGRPGQWWDKLASAAVGALAAGFAAAILKLLFR